MFKYIIIFIIFFSNIFSIYSYKVDINNESNKKVEIRNPIQNSKSEVINEMKNNFEIKKQELIKDYKNKKIGLKEAKQKLLKYRQSYIDEGKKKLLEEREKSKNNEFKKLKSQVKTRINIKLEKFSKLEKIKRDKIYEVILSKINKGLENKNISSKQKLLYNILKDIFSDLLQK